MRLIALLLAAVVALAGDPAHVDVFVFDAATGLPVGGAEIRAGGAVALSDEAGFARLEVAVGDVAVAVGGFDVGSLRAVAGRVSEVLVTLEPGVGARATGIEAQASERRSQGENKSMALKRLRRRLAVNARVAVNRDRPDVSALWASRRQGDKLSVNPEHRDYPALLAEALDLVVARRFDLAGAAGKLGVTMSQLSRLIRHDKAAFAAINTGRADVGLPPLRS